MTVFIDNYPTMQGYYLINSVNYNALTSDPVTIEFRSPEREEKEIDQLAIGAKYENMITLRGF
jgi:hypothetical protein